MTAKLCSTTPSSTPSLPPQHSLQQFLYGHLLSHMKDFHKVFGQSFHHVSHYDQRLRTTIANATNTTAAITIKTKTKFFCHTQCRLQFLLLLLQNGG